MSDDNVFIFYTAIQYDQFTNVLTSWSYIDLKIILKNGIFYRNV